MAIPSFWLNAIEKYKPHYSRYQLVVNFLEFCVENNYLHALNNRLSSLVTFDPFTFIETIETLNNERFGINSHTIGLFDRGNHDFKSILQVLIELKSQGIVSNEITELVCALYGTVKNNFYPNFDENLLTLLKKLYQNQELNSSVVLLLKESTPEFQPALEGLSLLKEANLYHKEYIKILAYRRGDHAVEYAKVLIILQKAGALNSEILTYFQSGFPHEYLSYLEQLQDKGQLNAKSAQWIMMNHHKTCFAGEQSPLQAYIILTHSNILFEPAQLLESSIAGYVCHLADLHCLTAEIYNALVCHHKQLKYLALINCFYLLEENNMCQPDLVLRLCKNELKRDELNTIIDSHKSSLAQIATQKALLSEGFFSSNTVSINPDNQAATYQPPLG